MDYQEKGRAGCTRAARKASSRGLLRLVHFNPKSAEQQDKPSPEQLLEYRKRLHCWRMMNARTVLARRAAQADLYAARWDEFEGVRGE